MRWLDSPGFERRPVVFVEDHLYHTGEVLDALAVRAPDLLRHVTVCVIDRPGPDTDATVTDWLRRHPDLQVVAATAARNRVRSIAAADLESAPAFATLVASLLRPGGVLVQDVQLTTLAFVPADRWWESIFVAATVRGLFADRAPTVRFLSNKHGYAATFGRDLMAAGFDPRDVLDKADVATVGVPAIAALVDRIFDVDLDVWHPTSGARGLRVSDQDRPDLEADVDLLLWPVADGLELGGRLVEKRVPLRAGGHEGDTWAALVRDRMDGGEGLAVTSVGERVGPAMAARAELTNVAARHLHTLRSRLRDGAAIVTAQHAYRLTDRVSVGQAHRHLRRPSA
jgi:hypothetical protein